MGPRYGPNSAAVERLLDDLQHLPTGEVTALAAAGGGVVGTADDDPDVTARAAVRGRLREVAVRAGRIDAVRAVGDDVAAWAASTSHWFPAGVAGTSDSRGELGPRLAAAPFVLDAAYAVVLEDLLADWELDLLIAPWEDVVGSPFGADTGADDDGDPWDEADDDRGGADEINGEDERGPEGSGAD